MDPRVEFVARSMHRADPSPSKAPSWESAAVDDQARYFELALAALASLGRFDAQRAGCAFAMGALRGIRTTPEGPQGGTQRALVEFSVPWYIVKHWSLGVPCELRVPLTHKGQREGNWSLFDEDPRDMGEYFAREFMEAQKFEGEPMLSENHVPPGEVSDAQA